jgi:hypothetical protein
MPIEARVVGLPGALVAVLLVVAMLLYLGGVAPFAPAERMTLPEAAALESDADIVRLLRAGADVNQAAWVRRTRIRPVHAMMTPIEAAMTSRHVSVMTLLADAGARITVAEIPVLWCLAVQQRNGDAQAWLRSRADLASSPDCADVRYPRIAP